MGKLSAHHLNPALQIFEDSWEKINNALHYERMIRS